jgi:hypothetical protein
MARPSKKRPWVVQMQIAATGKWYALSAYSDKDEADAQASLVLKRGSNAEVRVVDHNFEEATKRVTF